LIISKVIMGVHMKVGYLKVFMGVLMRTGYLKVIMRVHMRTGYLESDFGSTHEDWLPQ